MVRTQRFHCRGSSSIPGRGTKIPQAVTCSQKKKRKKERKRKNKFFKRSLKVFLRKRVKRLKKKEFPHLASGFQRK